MTAFFSALNWELERRCLRQPTNSNFNHQGSLLTIILVGLMVGTGAVCGGMDGTIIPCMLYAIYLMFAAAWEATGAFYQDAGWPGAATSVQFLVARVAVTLLPLTAEVLAVTAAGLGFVLAGACPLTTLLLWSGYSLVLVWGYGLLGLWWASRCPVPMAAWHRSLATILATLVIVPLLSSLLTSCLGETGAYVYLVHPLGVYGLQPDNRLSLTFEPPVLSAWLVLASFWPAVATAQLLSVLQCKRETETVPGSMPGGIPSHFDMGYLRRSLLAPMLGWPALRGWWIKARPAVQFFFNLAWSAILLLAVLAFLASLQWLL